VAHGVPSWDNIARIQSELQLTYDTLTLAQIPRWLTPLEKRESLESGLMVLAFAVTVDLQKSIGSAHIRVEENCAKCHVTTNSAMLLDVQTANYMAIPQDCREETPIYAICAKTHETRFHPCGIPTCTQGPSCLHPPIMCRAFQQLHKASDSNCAAKGKAEQSAIARRSNLSNVEESHTRQIRTQESEDLIRFATLVITEIDRQCAQSGYTPAESQDINMEATLHDIR
jgi:hypothetical protein